MRDTSRARPRTGMWQGGEGADSEGSRQAQCMQGGGGKWEYITLTQEPLLPLRGSARAAAASPFFHHHLNLLSSPSKPYPTWVRSSGMCTQPYNLALDLKPYPKPSPSYLGAQCAQQRQVLHEVHTQGAVLLSHALCSRHGRGRARPRVPARP